MLKRLAVNLDTWNVVDFLSYVDTISVFFLLLLFFYKMHKTILTGKCYVYIYGLVQPDELLLILAVQANELCHSGTHRLVVLNSVLRTMVNKSHSHMIRAFILFQITLPFPLKKHNEE